jgi:hypothetical protein
LIENAKGDLFGTTEFGGPNGYPYSDGTVFELVKTGSGYTEKVLHRFSGSPTDGAYPYAGLIADAKGDLFGTTEFGGPNGYPDHDGTVFELVNKGSGYTEKVLHSFSGGTTDGDDPIGGLVADAKGDLFGTTYEGGASARASTSTATARCTGSGYTEKVLHSFNGSDGSGANAGLIADANGDLFGTTELGGAHSDGTAFKLVKAGSGYTEKVLHSFRGGTKDGYIPQGGLIADAKGDLFGTTVDGGAFGEGTAFELVKTSSGYTEKVLHSFSGTSADTAASITGVLNGLHFG